MKYRIVSCLAAVVCTVSIEAGEIYTPHERHTRLGIIDPATGAGTDIGSFEQSEPGYRLASAAFDVQGDLYSIALLPANAGSQLLSVDLTTGAATTIGPRGDIPLLGMEVDANDTMYAVQYVVPEIGLGGDPELFTVDRSSGALTPIGNTGVVRSMDLAFDSQDTLWILGGPDGGNKLYTIDTNTGASTFVTEITGIVEATEPTVEMMGIMFDEHDNLYGTAFLPAPEPNPFTSPLFSIDTATGAATVIGQTGLRLPHGGDYLVPEPSSSLLVLVGGLLGAMILRRRFREGE